MKSTQTYKNYSIFRHMLTTKILKYMKEVVSGSSILAI